jgi:hypothetical protein
MSMREACPMTLSWAPHSGNTEKQQEGSAEWLSSRFACVRVGVGHNKLIPEKLSQEVAADRMARLGQTSGV